MTGQTHELSEGHGQIIAASHFAIQIHKATGFCLDKSSSNKTQSAGTGVQLGRWTVRTAHRNKAAQAKGRTKTDVAVVRMTRQSYIQFSLDFILRFTHFFFFCPLLDLRVFTTIYNHLYGLENKVYVTVRGRNQLQ